MGEERKSKEKSGECLKTLKILIDDAERILRKGVQGNALKLRRKKGIPVLILLKKKAETEKTRRNFRRKELRNLQSRVEAESIKLRVLPVNLLLKMTGRKEDDDVLLTWKKWT